MFKVLVNGINGTLPVNVMPLVTVNVTELPLESNKASHIEIALTVRLPAAASIILFTAGISAEVPSRALAIVIVPVDMAPAPRQQS